MEPSALQGTGQAVSPASHALTRIYEANVDTVFGYVMTRCGSRHVAEEVAAETFAEAARAYNAGRVGEIERGWLIHVARLRLIDHWRRQSRQDRKWERLVALTVRDRTVQDEHEQEHDPYILEALDSLSTRQRAALVLRYVDDYSVSEVAETLAVSYQATESLLARARRALLAAYRSLEEQPV